MDKPGGGFGGGGGGVNEMWGSLCVCVCVEGREGNVPFLTICSIAT